MDYKEALAYLDSFIDYEKLISYDYKASIGLERISAILQELGNPHVGPDVIHVAGTKGKGSVCAMTASILKEAGHKTGLYTSPHLISVRERIKIDGDPISTGDLCEVLEDIKPHVEAVKKKV
ncbi:MAG: hypothetical protein ABH825_03510 [Candidatus Omnitrophota bacterium]